MLKSCPRCGKIHPRGKCERAPDSFCRPRSSDADKFRNTRRWRRKASEIIERDAHCCRMCLKAGVANSRELSVHHITPLSADFDRRLDNDNLVTLCRFHHEQAERGRIKRRELAELAAVPADIASLTGGKR